MSNWHILGVGAIGSLWACYLHQSGHHIELLFKDRAALERYHARGGLQLVEKGNAEQLCLDAGVGSDSGAPAEFLLIATKAHQTLDALRMAGARLGAGTRVLLLQNGMGIAEQVNRQFPGQRLYCGVTTDGAYCPQPFTVVHAGRGRTDIGAFRHAGDPQIIVDQLPVSHLDIAPCDDIEAWQWRKLAMNCAINGLTVSYRCRNGELLEHDEARERMAMLCEEIKQVGNALGYGTWVADLYQKTEAVLQATAANYNSMYQDVAQHRQTEIDYLNGYLLQQAQELGIQCPENAKLYKEIKRMELELECN